MKILSNLILSILLFVMSYFKAYAGGAVNQTNNSEDSDIRLTPNKGCYVKEEDEIKIQEIFGKLRPDFPQVIAEIENGLNNDMLICNSINEERCNEKGRCFRSQLELNETNDKSALTFYKPCYNLDQEGRIYTCSIHEMLHFAFRYEPQLASDNDPIEAMEPLIKMIVENNYYNSWDPLSAKIALSKRLSALKFGKYYEHDWQKYHSEKIKKEMTFEKFSIAGKEYEIPDRSKTIYKEEYNKGFIIEKQKLEYSIRSRLTSY
jgi:hypothetical protein